MVTFIKDPAGWNLLVKSPSSPIFKDLTQRGIKLQRYATRQVGKKTRALATTITTKTTIDFRGMVNTTGSSNKIAYLHHQGTRPHIIVPRRAKTLRFVQRGKIRYSQKVHHPGTKPNRYLTDNLIKVVV